MTRNKNLFFQKCSLDIVDLPFFYHERNILISVGATGTLSYLKKRNLMKYVDPALLMLVSEVFHDLLSTFQHEENKRKKRKKNLVGNEN